MRFARQGATALSLVTGAEATLLCLPNEPDKWTLKHVITDTWDGDSSDMKKCVAILSPPTIRAQSSVSQLA